jgi:hypothetical protein
MRGTDAATLNLSQLDWRDSRKDELTEGEVVEGMSNGDRQRGSARWPPE